MLDEEDRHALVPDRADQGGDTTLLGGGQAGSRLVEEQEPRPRGQRDRELQQPLLAPRQLDRTAPPAPGEADEGEDRVGVAREPRLLGPDPATPAEDAGERRRAPEVKAGEHVVEGRELREHARPLERADDSAGGDLAGTEPTERRVAVADLAAERTDVAGDRVERRRLPGPVGPDQARDRAGLDPERDARQRRHAAEGDGEVPDDEAHRRARHAASIGTTPCGRRETVSSRNAP